MQGSEGLFEPVLVSDEIASATSASNWVQKMVDVECALALAQAEMRLIPAAAAGEINELRHSHGLDATDLGRSARSGGTPVIPLVRLLSEKLSESSKPWIHYGATSQDILDSATMLICKEAIEVIFVDLVRIGKTLSELAKDNRNVPMVGRTLMQHALPTTFGLKASMWLGGVITAGDSLARVYREDLALQFGGAGGTLAALGDSGMAVGEKVADLLGLQLPMMPWHAQRERIADIGSSLTMVIGSHAKIATDVALGSQMEIGEISESLGGGGGSSAMPQKVNPVGAIVVNAAFRRAQGLLPVLFGCLVAENERGASEWQAEWQTLRDLIQLAGGASNRTAQTVSNLVINKQKMFDNLQLSRGNVMSERVLLKLSESLGRTVAHDLVREATQRSSLNQTTLSEELSKESVFQETFSQEEVNDLFDPMTYLGSAQSFIDNVTSTWDAISPNWPQITNRKS